MMAVRRRSDDSDGAPLDIDGGTADVEDLLAPSAPEIDLTVQHLAGGALTAPADSSERVRSRSPGMATEDLLGSAASAAIPSPVPPDRDEAATPHATGDSAWVASALQSDDAVVVATLRPAAPGIIRAALIKACHGSHRPMLKLLGLAGIGISGYRGPKSDDHPLRVWQPGLAVATHRPQEPDPARTAENYLSQVFPDGDADLLLVGLGDTDGVPLTLAHRRGGSTTVITTAVAPDPTPADVQLLTALQAPDQQQADRALGDAWWSALSAHPAGRAGDQGMATDSDRPPPPSESHPPPDAHTHDRNPTHNPLGSAITGLGEAAQIPLSSTTEVILVLVNRLVAIAEENGRLRAELRAARGSTTCDK